MKKSIILLAALFIPFNTLANSESLIKGFAKYQAGRIENIILNNIVDDIEENIYFKRMFSKTSVAVSNYDDVSGRRLIPLMQHFIKQDIKNFQKFSECVIERVADGEDVEEIKTHFLTDEKTVDDYINAYCASEDIDLKLVVDSIISDFTAQKISDSLMKLSSSKDVYLSKATNAIKSSKCLYDNKIILSADQNCLDVVKESIKASAKEKLNQLKTNLDSKIKSVGDVDEGKTKKFLKALKEYLDAAGCKYDGDFSCNGELSYFVKMHYLITAFQILDDKERDKYTSFKKKALFLASLTDAVKKDGSSSADEVAGIIKSYVQNENEPFFEKRQGVGFFSRYCGYKMCTNNPKLIIASYFGAAFTFNHSVSKDDNRELVPYGPLGIEFRLANFWGKPLSIGYAPLDLGVPISNELRDKEYTAEFEDIRSDNIYLSFSFKTKPVSILLSRQQNRNNSTGQKESVNMISLVFDLPLYSF